MSDIFITYAREDRTKAELLARAFESQGWSVWWDPKIPPGRSFDETIEEALDAAGCVVVLWSESSVRSQWVKAEAEEGHKRRVLVPVLLSDVKIPLGFRLLQAANLKNWSGDTRDEEFAKLCHAIRELSIPSSVASEESQNSRDETPTRPDSPKYGPKTYALLILLAAVIALVAVGMTDKLWRSEPPHHEVTMSLLEEVGRISYSRTGLVELPNPDERALRDAFLAGNLPEDLERRFARFLLDPEIAVSDYVSPAISAGITSQGLDEWPRLWHRWNLICVIRGEMHLDGEPFKRISPTSAYELIRFLSVEELARLPLGIHKISTTLEAWFLDYQETLDFEGNDSSKSPTLVFDDEGNWDHVLFGAKEERWESYWPRLKERLADLHLKDLHFVICQFQYVDSLPEGYPTPLSSRELDIAMRKSIVIDNVRAIDSANINYSLRTNQPLPAPLAARLAFYSAFGELLASRGFDLRQGQTTNATSGFLAREFISRRGQPDGTKDHPNREARIFIRVIGDREVARSTLGFNSYWDGTLEFDEPVRFDSLSVDGDASPR